MTHPFHPLHGKQYELLHCRNNWGEYRVYFLDEAGQMASLCASWTDVDPPEPFVDQSNGRAVSTPDCLLQLCRLRDELLKSPVKKNKSNA